MRGRSLKLPKIVYRSIELAMELFPSAYNPSTYRTYHFCFLYRKNQLLAIGVNKYKEGRKTLRVAQLTHVEHFRKYKYAHAEVDAIGKLLGRQMIDSSIKCVVIRVNRFGQLKMSKPCKNCREVLLAFGINKVWWSNQNGGIEYGI